MTDRQRQVLSFVAHATAEHGYPPSLREIGERFGVSHVGARRHVESLIRQGFMARDFGVYRGLRVLADPH